jgi:hypothetical protein
MKVVIDKKVKASVFVVVLLVLLLSGLFVVSGKTKAAGTTLPYQQAAALLNNPCYSSAQLTPYSEPWKPWQHISQRFFGFEHRQILLINPSMHIQHGEYVLIDSRTHEAFSISDRQIVHASADEAYIPVYTRYTLFHNPLWESDPWTILWKSSCK